MQMLIGGEWIEREERIEVINPYDGTVVDTVPHATEEDAVSYTHLTLPTTERV